MDKQAKHTPGPWRTQGWVPTWAYIPILDARHNLVCSLYPNVGRSYTREEVEANAHRIVACINAMAGLSNEQVSALRASHAELRIALEKLIEHADLADDFRYGTLGASFVRDIARAALANAPE